MNSQFALPLSAAGSNEDATPLVTPCNAAVERQLMQWPEWPFHCAILVGPPLSGKSVFGRFFLTESQGIVIDDADLCEQELLFHEWNRAQSDAKPILFASRHAPAEWPGTLADLRSRLHASLTIAIPPPDMDLAALLLQKHLQNAGTVLPDRLARFAALRVERSYDAIARLAAQLDQMALAIQRPIGQKMIVEALGGRAEEEADDGQ